MSEPTITQGEVPSNLAAIAAYNATADEVIQWGALDPVARIFWLTAYQCGRSAGIEAGKLAERQAIVDWLRQHKAFATIGARFMADAIDCGEHIPDVGNMVRDHCQGG